MRAREPAVAVESMMIKAQLADELRVLRAATLHAVAHVENYQTIAPIGEIRQTIFDLYIMQVATNDFPVALSGGNRRRNLTGNLPARYFFRMLHIGEINHAHGTRGVIRQVHIMTLDKRAMHAARNSFGVFGNWSWVSRIGGV